MDGGGGGVIGTCPSDPWPFPHPRQGGGKALAADTAKWNFLISFLVEKSYRFHL